MSNATIGSNQTVGVDKNMTKNATGIQFVNLVEKLNQAEKANKNVFDTLNSKLQDTEFLQQSAMENTNTTTESGVSYDPY